MVATYRLQLHPEFGFSDAERALPYLRQLGVSHLYLSPITEARPGSTHGYDVIDHNAVREEIGGREGFDRLVQAAYAEGLEIVIDFVPNHAGVGPQNSYWQDVLAFGPHSIYAPYFDVDWNPIKPELQGKILLPFLGNSYGEVLDGGELSLAYVDGYFYATYYESPYRLNPASYTHILERVLRAAERTEPYWDLKDLVEAYRSLRAHEREKSEALRMRLMNLVERVSYEEIFASFTPAELHDLLEAQFWRLSFWKTAGHEINYRRFFDINGLVALRMEDDHVFWDAHQLLAELMAMEGVAGVRIDHIDGLFDPHGYLDRLSKVGRGHIWVEKILAPGETIPDAWPVSGTTGYEFLNDVMGVLLRDDGRIPLEKTYRRVLGAAPTFQDDVYESKKVVIETSLSSELFRLSYELDRISEADYHTRDFTLEAIRQALTDVVAVFDRYRTYLPHDPEAARDVIRPAVYRARARNPVAEPTVYDFIASVILGEVREDLKDVQRAFVGRFQQYTAPVAAKGVEDTAFYRYLPLAGLNEVGGEPGEFGTSLHAFHSRARFRAHRYPHNLLTTATHDHKRGEDTRMRMIALTEIPDQWEGVVRDLLEIGEMHISDAGPSRADQYLFFQTLAALWHGSDHAELVERLWLYMQKATRESKRQTSWTNPDEAYEEALEAFVKGMLEDDRVAETLDDLSRRLAHIGFHNTLSQVILKLTTPGLPDIYQGCELLDLSLVDPDNRRPVDYDQRARALESLGGLIANPDVTRVRSLLKSSASRVQDSESNVERSDATGESLRIDFNGLGEWEIAKLYVTAALLQLRRKEPELLAGDYFPVDVESSEHWIVFSRTNAEKALLVVVGRWHTAWDENSDAAISLPSQISDRRWTDVLTGALIEAGSTLSLNDLPMRWAVLIS